MATEEPTVAVTQQEVTEAEADVATTSPLLLLQTAGNLAFEYGDDAQTQIAQLDRVINITIPQLEKSGILDLDDGSRVVIKSLDKQIDKLVEQLKADIPQDQKDNKVKELTFKYHQIQTHLKELYEEAEGNEQAKQEPNAADKQSLAVLNDTQDVPAATAPC